MKKLIEKKGGRVAETAIIGWGSKKREMLIDDMSSRFSQGDPGLKQWNIIMGGKEICILN